MPTFEVDLNIRGASLCSKGTQIGSDLFAFDKQKAHE